MKETHRIDDISFTDEVSFLVCTCGSRAESHDPEDLVTAFQRHREELGLQRKTLSSGVYNDGSIARLSIR